MKYIYLITSPSGKQYIGQSKVSIEQKIKFYLILEKNKKSNRLIANAIQKYGWAQMKFEILESNDNWSQEQLNSREIFWIEKYNTLLEGYNMTSGGEGVDSECARSNAIKHHRTMSNEKKAQRAENCSKGQLKRFQQQPDSEETKKRKRDSHNGLYRIESPDGRVWETNIGLKGFAEEFKNEIQITYWQLFSAYRKCYTNTLTIRKMKNNNCWKVIRLDKFSYRYDT
jgi:group I intron endonuclease